VSDVDEHIHFLRGLFDETSESGERCNEIADILSRLRADLAQRTAERDEARRSACAFKARYLESIDGFPLPTDDEIGIKTRAIARRMGWDCFHATEGER
jgi:hypothetical protein